MDGLECKPTAILTMHKAIGCRIAITLLGLACLVPGGIGGYVIGWGLIAGSGLNLFIYCSTLERRFVAFILCTSITTASALLFALSLSLQPALKLSGYTLIAFIIAAGCFVLIEYFSPVVVDLFIKRSTDINLQNESKEKPNGN